MVPGGSPSSTLNSRAEISLRSIPATVLLRMGAFSFSLSFCGSGTAPLDFLHHHMLHRRKPGIRRRRECERLVTVTTERHECEQFGFNPTDQSTEIQPLRQVSIGQAR